MAQHEQDPHKLAKNWFTAAIVGAAIYIGVVIVWIM